MEQEGRGCWQEQFHRLGAWQTARPVPVLVYTWHTRLPFCHLFTDPYDPCARCQDSTGHLGVIKRGPSPPRIDDGWFQYLTPSGYLSGGAASAVGTHCRPLRLCPDTAVFPHLPITR